MEELREEQFGLHRGSVFFPELEAIQPLNSVSLGMSRMIGKG
jgi:hypothetical protein